MGKKKMNEDKHKVKLGKKNSKCCKSYWVKPCGKFWKRLFNKRVRKGGYYKGSNWMEWF